MKKISLILVLIILTACQKQSQIDYAIVKGKITNKGELNNLTVTNTDRDFNYEIELLEDGSFLDTLTLDSGLYTLSAGRRKSVQIVFFKGDDFNINADADNFESSLTFEGKGSIENTVLQTINEKIKEWDNNKANNYPLEEDDYKSLILKEKEDIKALLNPTEPINPQFQELMTRHIDYWYLFNLIYYAI